MPVISAHALRKEFQLGPQKVAALAGVDFEIGAGEVVGIVGPSGSGKSTLLGLMGGLDQPTSGSISIGGVEISRLGERELTNIRNEKLGFVRTSPCPSSSRGGGCSSRSSGRGSCWSTSGSGTGWGTGRASSRAASSSGWRSPAPWPTTRRSC